MPFLSYAQEMVAFSVPPPRPQPYYPHLFRIGRGTPVTLQGLRPTRALEHMQGCSRPRAQIMFMVLLLKHVVLALAIPLLLSSLIAFLNLYIQDHIAIDIFPPKV